MATTTRTKAAQRFMAAVEQSWDTRDPLEQTAAHGLSEYDADALAEICDETGDDLETATADVLAAVREKLAATAS